MKVNAQNMWLCAVVLVALATPGLGRADDSDLLLGSPVPVGPPPGGFSQLPQAAALDRAKALFVGGFGTSGARGNNNAAAIRKAAEAVRDAKESQEKESAQKKLVELL